MAFIGWNKKSTNKFGARKSVYKGIEFDSTVERQRYVYLEYQQKIGEISGLRLQTRFEIISRTTKIVPTQLKTKIRYDERVVEMAANYTADFVYIENGVYVMEDVKNDYSQEIRDYPLRRKLMIKKIQAHNAKGHGHWIFRESVYRRDKKLHIKDIEP